jgi:hypothetical protein
MSLRSAAELTRYGHHVRCRSAPARVESARGRRTSGASAASRSGACAVERAALLRHLARNALDRPGANAALFRNRQHALLGPQQTLNSLFELSRYPRATQLFALFHGPLEPRIDAVTDHAAFEFSECSRDLKHEATRGGRRVDRLLIEVQVDAIMLERLDGAEQVDQRTAQPVDSPGHHDVKSTPLGILEQLVKAGPGLAALRAADAGVSVLLDDFPASALGNPMQFAQLVFNRLFCRSIRGRRLRPVFACQPPSGRPFISRSIDWISDAH